MDFHEDKIGKKQAEEFAKAIFADIETYVNEHLEEFEEFCLKEESEVKENDVKKGLFPFIILYRTETAVVSINYAVFYK